MHRKPPLQYLPFQMWHAGAIALGLSAGPLALAAPGADGQLELSGPVAGFALSSKSPPRRSRPAAMHSAQADLASGGMDRFASSRVAAASQRKIRAPSRGRGYPRASWPLKDTEASGGVACVRGNA